MIRNLDLDKALVILEAGCGRGQLTVPFAKKLKQTKKDMRFVAFDISAGPYQDALDTLKERIREERLESLIVPVKGDVRDMKAVHDESIDLIISNELFCDLDEKGLEMVLEEFHRILKPGGQMAHGELNPFPENEAQKLLIEADGYSLETLEPKPTWFSPFSDEVAMLMRRIGFRSIVVRYFETNVRMDCDTAIRKLKDWGTDPAFVERHLDDLRRYGLEFPTEHVIFCQK